MQLGPWLFITMIGELDVHVTDLWKYDDTTISETVSKNQNSHTQAAVDILANCASLLVRSRSIHVLSSLTVSPCTLVKTCHVISRHVGRFWLTSTQPYRLLHLKEESIIEVTFSHRFVQLKDISRE